MSTTDTGALRSPLHDEHLALGATMTEFAGWDMPLRYSGDVAEHTAVRTAAGLYDLSHMGELMVTGPDAAAALDYALVGHMSRMRLWAAKYTMMCDASGGIVDDLVVYRRDWDHFMVVANASNRVEVAGELAARFAAGGFDASVSDETASLALIAVQGPAAAAIVGSLCAAGESEPATLKYYSAANLLLEGGHHAFVARTGYTGEDGFELFVGADVAAEVWRSALAAGASHGLIPCGLASRDSLRLEAGMPLYGHELSADTTPFDAGLGRVVAFEGPAVVLSSAQPGAAAPGAGLSDQVDPRAVSVERGAFVGREALAAVAASGPAKVLVGLVGEGRRSPRAGYAVTDTAGNQVGIVTSGIPSPTLGQPIAMAYVPPTMAEVGTEVGIDVRGRREQMRVVALPFYKRQG